MLFLREKGGETLTYQMFVEPKGNHLREHDRWKEEFLKKVTQKVKCAIASLYERDFAGETLEFRTRSGKQTYRLTGVPFYNNEDENAFGQRLYGAMGK